MGYNTSFSGSFKIEFKDETKREQILLAVKKIDASELRGSEKAPNGGYFDFEIKEKNEQFTLEWNYAEKSNYYIEWLQYALDEVFIPLDAVLNGEMKFQGEEVGDNGIIYIKNNVLYTSEGLMKEVEKIANNVLYFNDSSDYQSALFDILSKITGKEYDDFPSELIE